MSSLKKSMKAVCSPRGRRPRMRPGAPPLPTLTVTRPRPSRFGSTESTSSHLKVCVRVRPVNDKECDGGKRVIVKPVDAKMLIFDPKEDDEPFFYQGVQQPVHNYLKKANKEMQFIFDNVFGMEATNKDVFDISTKEIINSLMDGYNCSVFVYGATGAGKTFTMLGCPEVPGITYLTMSELFENIDVHKHEREFEICVSYLEIYNENVYDLLHHTGSPLHLREDGKYGVQIAGLSSKSIHTAQELLDMLDKGNNNRTQHPTDANAESSRSHAVFQVYVKMRAKATNQAKIVKLSMIDLAGSERASATNGKGDRFKEGANINRSLLALGNCINQLADGSKFIPYRDSKLTRLLKDSLGGNCRTVMIANVAPTISSYEDTYNTLKYATRANKIQQKMKKNIISCDGHVAQYIKQAEELKERVVQLEAELAKAKEKQSVTVPGELDGVTIKLLNKWSIKLKSEGDRYFKQFRDFLQMIAKKQGLIVRAIRKRRIAFALSALCSEVSDEQLKEACQKDVSRMNLAVDTFIRQAKVMVTELKVKLRELQVQEKNFSSLQAQALAECPLLEHLITSLRFQNDLILSQAKEEYLKSLATSQHDEVDGLNSFIKNSLKMLKMYYLRLKSQGIFTSSMFEEYNDLIRQARSTRTVTWDDERNMDYSDSNLKYLIELDVDTVNIPEALIAGILNVAIKQSDEETAEEDMFEDFLKSDSADVATSDSADLNVTYTESNFQSHGQLNTVFPQKCIDDMILSLENSQHQFKLKSINPVSLNSTLVLAQKSEPELTNKHIKPFEFKTVLLERTNTMPNEKLSLGPSKKPTGKITPFKKQEIRSGFGSSASRFQFPRPTTPSNGMQLGCKTVRSKERLALNSVLPYRKPLSKK